MIYLELSPEDYVHAEAVRALVAQEVIDNANLGGAEVVVLLGDFTQLVGPDEGPTEMALFVAVNQCLATCRGEADE